ncbi:hypothetical protein ACFLUM_02555 [Chloroflexota bacterium]
MRIVTNEAKIERGARLGKIATFAGLGLLAGGLVISLVFQESPLLWLSFLCLVLGLLVSSVGTLNMNRWVREPRADQALAQGLKGFDDQYVLYNHTLPAPHVLLGSTGLYVLTAMGQDGAIRYSGGKFRRDFSLGRVVRFMADEGLGRPLAEAEGQVQAMSDYLEENGFDDSLAIQNLLVFYSPKAQLSVSDPPLPVVVPKTLKKAIRKVQDGKLAADQYRELLNLFENDLE